MSSRSALQFAAALGWIIAALGGHWFISGANHPGVSTAETVQAWVMLIGGGALGWLAWRRSRIMPPAA